LFLAAAAARGDDEEEEEEEEEERAEGGSERLCMQDDSADSSGATVHTCIHYFSYRYLVVYYVKVNFSPFPHPPPQTHIIRLTNDDSGGLRPNHSAAQQCLYIYIYIYIYMFEMCCFLFGILLSFLKSASNFLSFTLLSAVCATPPKKNTTRFHNQDVVELPKNIVKGLPSDG
jgi:hypothetical protein